MKVSLLLANIPMRISCLPHCIFLNIIIPKKMLNKYGEEDYTKANQYALKSKNNLLINSTYNNLGYYYRKRYELSNEKKFLASAQESYQKSHQYALLIKEPAAQKRSLIAYYLNYGVMVNTDKTCRL